MIDMGLEMSFRIIQSARKAVLDTVDMPGASGHRAEVSADLRVCVLVAVEISLRGFADPTIAVVWLNVSIDMTATEGGQLRIFLLGNGRGPCRTYLSNARERLIFGHCGHLNSFAIAAGVSRSTALSSIPNAGVGAAAAY